jgi:conjugal transfer pilus assembly protein TraU
MPIGLMMSWYEPSRFIDVTRTPFCMVGLGGIDLSAGLSDILPAPGYGDEKHGMQTQSSFYQVHWFMDPIMAILGIIDTACNVGMSKSMDLMFMSEVDPRVAEILCKSFFC